MDDREENGVERDKRKPLLEPGVIKAFAAGMVIGNLNKHVMLGFLVGLAGGVFVQQNYSSVPDVRDTWRDFCHRVRESKKK